MHPKKLMVKSTSSFLALVAAFCSSTAQAQSTYTAASCSYSDVNAIVNGPTHTAVNGDTIIIPSGTCTWTSELSITVGLHLTGSGSPNTGTGTFGAGASSTTIIDNVSGPIIQATGIPVGQTLSVSLLNIDPNGSTTTLTSPIYVVGTCTSSGCANFRGDNLTFTGWTEAGNGTQASWLIRTDNVFGVLDHNTLPSGSGVTLANVHHSSYLGVGQYGDNSWTQPDSFGTSNALYFENNSINTSLIAGIEDCDESPGTTGGGCRIVVRYNKMTMNGGSILYFHGTDSTDRVRGGRQGEVYGNTITCTNTTQGCATGAALRSGVLLNYSNTYITSAGSWFNNLVELDEYRTWSSFPPWGWCDGTGAFDNNDGTVYASGTVTGVSTSGGALVITDSSKSWTSSLWVNNGSPYSVVDTTQKAGFEIAASSSDTITAPSYSQDYYNGPPTINVGDNYQILRASVCIDQPSRSGGTYLSGTVPSAGRVNQSLDPTYEWNDNISSATVFHGTIGSDTAKIIANRDYYYQNPSFNGSSGTGVGLYSAIPSTCTSSVAYWATDKNTLYRCSAQNTWTVYYTPFSYPHPLTQQGPSPVPPTNLEVTVQ